MKASDLLGRVLKVADTALGKLNERDAQGLPVAAIGVSVGTVEQLEKEVTTWLQDIKQEHPRAVDDECRMLLQCLRRVLWAHEDGDGHDETKWRTLAEAFLPFVRTAHARAVTREEQEAA